MAGRLALIARDGDYVAARCLSLVAAGRDLGMGVTVVTGDGGGHEAIARAGADLVELRLGRGFDPMSAGYAAGQLAQVLKGLEPDLVHCVGLGPTLVGGTACALAGVQRRVFEPGLPGGDAPLSRLGQRALRAALSAPPLRSPSTRIVAGTDGEAAELGLDREGSPPVIVVSRAGIDGERLRPAALPPSRPLKLALVARAAEPDGIANAVAAVAAVRERGVAVELSLYRGPSATRWGALADARLAAWGSEPGVTWRGAATDIVALWRDHHAACLSERWRDDTAAAMLEAASCGRAIVAVDGPQSRAFLRDGQEGFLVSPGDPVALADAFAKLAADPVLLPRMGAAARARALDGWTERDAATRFRALHEEMLGGVATG